MAKTGLDFFPLNVDFFEDDKIEYVTARFHEKGELITIKLLCAIYRNGYYTDWNEDKALIFANRVGKNVTHSLVNDVVYELVKRGFFDGSIFNSFGILTSRGIQKRFLRVVTDSRNEVEINADYWVIDLPNNTRKTTFLINRPISEENRPIFNKNRSINEQSKVKESKEKKTKENIIKDVSEVDTVTRKNSQDDDELSPDTNESETSTPNPFKHYERLFGLLRPIAIDEIKSYLDNGIDAGLVCLAMDRSCEYGARHWNYAKTILDSCVINKVFTVEIFLKEQEQYRAQRSAKSFNKFKGANRSGIATKHTEPDREKQEDVYGGIKSFKI